MSDNIYQLAGKVNVPAEKRDEMNRYVLEIMDKCGIRKIREMTVAGEKIPVVSPARPDANGIVLFDYSIFEKEKKKVSTYDFNTCELHVEDRGYGEFGLAINLIMALQEAYTDGDCYLIKSGRPCYLGACLVLLHGILGERIMLPGRGRLWDMYLFFRNTENCKSLTLDDLYADHSKIYGKIDREQFLAVMEVEDKELLIPDKNLISRREEICSASSCSQVEYAHRIFRELDEGEKAVMKSFLAKLLNADFTERQKLSARRDARGIIAELSLYVLPARILLAYAQAVGSDFWEMWDSLVVKGYSDILQGKKQKDAGTDFGELRELPFYKAIQRKNEDEFLEFWDGSNLLLSREMQECIRGWQEQFRDIDTVSVASTEHFLAEIICRLKNSHCRYVDGAFVSEFIDNGADENYKKALALIKKLLDKGQEYFPELTGKQADLWLISSVRDKFDYIAVSALISLLGNVEQRKVAFGF